MHINKIGFGLSQETFDADKFPTDVVEIYVDEEKLTRIIRSGAPMWPSEIYTSLMGAFRKKDEAANIFVCGCGCVGCGDTEVFIEE